MSYTPDIDRPHMPVDDADWQESDCTWFYDARAGLGGFYRLGYHARAGEAAILLFVCGPDGTRFRHVERLAVDPDARKEDGQSAPGCFVRALDPGEMAYGWDYADCHAALRFTDPFYEPRGWAKDEGDSALNAKLNDAGHLECSGRMKGEITLGGTRFEIDALAHRDRSWGVRRTAMLVQHRMCTGSFGPELSFATTIVQLPNGMAHKAGFVARNGETTDIADVEIVTGLLYDGYSTASGRCVITLPDGEILTIDTETLDGFVHLYGDDYVTGDHLSVARCGDLTGFADLEASVNPARGSYVPSPADLVSAALENGLSHKPG